MEREPLQHRVPLLPGQDDALSAARAEAAEAAAVGKGALGRSGGGGRGRPARRGRGRRLASSEFGIAVVFGPLGCGKVLLPELTVDLGL